MSRIETDTQGEHPESVRPEHAIRPGGFRYQVGSRGEPHGAQWPSMRPITTGGGLLAAAISARPGPRKGRSGHCPHLGQPAEVGRRLASPSAREPRGYSNRPRGHLPGLSLLDARRRGLGASAEQQRRLSVHGRRKRRSHDGSAWSAPWGQADRPGPARSARCHVRRPPGRGTAMPACITRHRPTPSTCAHPTVLLTVIPTASSQAITDMYASAANIARPR